MTNMDRRYVITMPDGSRWAVPVWVIAEHRANHYAFPEFSGDAERSLTEDTAPVFNADASEIEDWAKNNMNWSDVEARAVCIEPPSCDYDDGWINGRADLL